MKAAPDPVDLQVAIHLTALVQSPPLVLSQYLPLALLNNGGVKLPALLHVLGLDIVACVAAENRAWESWIKRKMKHFELED